jgi:hypothetical protein
MNNSKLWYKIVMQIGRISGHAINEKAHRKESVTAIPKWNA